jgi:hypothetical protein
LSSLFRVLHPENHYRAVYSMFQQPCSKSYLMCLCGQQDSKFWKLYKEDPPACAVVLKTAVGLVHLLATLLEPFMPSFSHKVLLSVGFPSPPDIRLKHNMFQESHSKFYVMQVHLS